MKETIKKNVKAMIRSRLDNYGLLYTIKDPNNDDEFDRAHASAEETARSVFNEARRQLRIAHATIQVALS